MNKVQQYINEIFEIGKTKCTFTRYITDKNGNRIDDDGNIIKSPENKQREFLNMIRDSKQDTTN